MFYLSVPEFNLKFTYHVSMTKAALNFRMEEEAKLTREKEVLELKLLSARGALSRESTELVIRSFCKEILLLWDGMLGSDFETAFTWIRALLMVFVSTIGVFELIAAMKGFVEKSLSSSKGLKVLFNPPKKQVFGYVSL